MLQTMGKAERTGAGLGGVVWKCEDGRKYR